MRLSKIAYGAYGASQSYAGTGTGTMTGLATRASAVAEVWTVKLITAAANGGTFSVTCSLSGAKANATVGTPYDNGFIAFTINDGATDFVVGDTFTVTVSRASTLALTIPTRSWSPGTMGVGAGSEESAAGVPSAWITRRDYTLRVPLRFTESEWPAVRAWIEDAQGGSTFDFYADAAAAAYHTCYLIDPKIDAAVEPTRGEHFGTFDLPVLIRTTAGTPIEPAYF